MNRFQLSTPRLPIGLAALAMTAFTIGAGIVAPATIEADRRGARAPVVSEAAASEAAAIVNAPLRVDVVGERERETAFQPTPPGLPKRRQAG